MKTCHRVLLLPSQDIGWATLRNTLRRDERFEIIGETSSLTDAADMIHCSKPDVIFATDRIEGEPVFSVLEEMRGGGDTHGPKLWFSRGRPQVVVLSRSFSSDQLPRLAAEGIAGYLLWEDITEPALSGYLGLVVAPSFVVLSREVARLFAEIRVGRHLPERSVKLPGAGERAVLQALARGESEKEVAVREHMSLRTVQRIIEELKVKYEAPSLFVLGMRAASGEIMGWE